jgi:hypothetical protein
MPAGSFARARTQRVWRDFFALNPGVKHAGKRFAIVTAYANITRLKH